MEITLKGLTKISLNQWYESKHWGNRQKQKDSYYWQVKAQFKHVFPKADKYIVEYEFEFKSRPLDAVNTIAMIKLIEDIIFEDDKWDIVTKIITSSKKGKEDLVKITITQSNENTGIITGIFRP